MVSMGKNMMGPMPLDTTRELARFVVATGYADLPEEAVQAAKRCLIDFLGVALRGSTEPIVSILADAASITGGKEQATVIGKGFKSSILEAATINSAMGHSLDYDDINDPAQIHPSVALFPAALAVAEWKNVSGQAMVTAYILGYEVMARIGLESGRTILEKGLHPTAVLGPYGAAAAAGKLLGLTVDQMVNAFGIAGVQTSGMVHAFGSMSKPFQVGRSAANGVLSTLLAQRGFTASQRVLEGPKGFFEVYVGSGNVANITRGLGRSYLVTKTYFKPHASCGGTHAPIDAAVEIRRSRHPAVADIADVLCEVRPITLKVASNPQPKTGLEGKFSVEYCVAVALAEGGDVRDDKFSEAKLNEPKLVNLEKKVRLLAREDYNMSQARMTVTMKSGAVYSHEVKCARGAPENPLSLDEIQCKFEALAGTVLPAGRVKQVLGLVSNVETLKDTASLLDLCQPRR